MKKKNDWKKDNWDKWAFWKKVRQSLTVVSSMIIVIGMWLVAAYVVLIMFGLYGFILKVRDTILLDIMHSIFG